MKLKIITMYDDRLKKKSCNIDEEFFFKYKEEIKNLSEYMKKLVIAESAAGIASIQIEDDPNFDFLTPTKEQRKQPSIIIAKLEDQKLYVFVNPKIINKSEKKVKSTEGCLSIPNMTYEIERFEYIEVEFQDIEGKKHKKFFYNFEAIVLQHEIDHLHGILYPDYISNFIKKELFWKKYNNSMRNMQK